MPTSNKLGDALSPYLLQHADNPVHWYPWGEEALELARRLDRPILLSVGYSACHWCHVMARESFRDEEIAERMNRDFINIKVDREERADLDRIYQLSHQLLTGQGGGWPLTVFLDPEDLAPFFAGTYYPPERRHGMIAFPELLARIDRVWKTRRGELYQQNQQLLKAMAALDEADPQAELPGAELAGECVEQLQNFFDRNHAGFGTGPKFPQAPVLELLATMTGRGQEESRYMLYGTLTAMARSGLVDHLAGGFYRYCVDGKWEIPHFEKMLYDSAQLLPLYAEMAVAWNEPEMAMTARMTMKWIESEMLLEDGGLASSLDADTPEGEGAYYLWTPDQVRSVLDSSDADVFMRRYGLDGPPNFESERWHLVVRRSLAESAGEDETEDQVGASIRQASRILLDERGRRLRPDRDDKVLAGWNGLAAAGMIRAGRILGEESWCKRGEAVLDFVQDRLFDQDPPCSVWRAGRADHMPTLDDFGPLIAACLESLQWDFDIKRLEWAGKLANEVIDRFQHPATGVLYLTGHDHERLVTRPRSQADEATPAGGGLALIGLLRLGHLTANEAWLGAAEKALAVAGPELRRQPTIHATWLRALVELHEPADQVLVGGPEIHRWNGVPVSPRQCIYRLTGPADGLPDILARVAGSTRPIAIVCRGTTCLAPVHEPDELARILDNSQPEKTE